MGTIMFSMGSAIVAARAEKKMRVETFLSKFYDVNVREATDIDGAIHGERHIEIYERGEDCEPIGWFLKLDGCDTYQWINIYGKVLTGTAYLGDAAIKAAAKSGIFYS